MYNVHCSMYIVHCTIILHGYPLAGLILFGAVCRSICLYSLCRTTTGTSAPTPTTSSPCWTRRAEGSSHSRHAADQQAIEIDATSELETLRKEILVLDHITLSLFRSDIVILLSLTANLGLVMIFLYLYSIHRAICRPSDRPGERPRPRL